MPFARMPFDFGASQMNEGLRFLANNLTYLLSLTTLSSQSPYSSNVESEPNSTDHVGSVPNYTNTSHSKQTLFTGVASVNAPLSYGITQQEGTQAATVPLVFITSSLRKEGFVDGCCLSFLEPEIDNGYSGSFLNWLATTVHNPNFKSNERKFGTPGAMGIEEVMFVGPRMGTPRYYVAMNLQGLACTEEFWLVMWRLNRWFTAEDITAIKLYLAAFFALCRPGARDLKSASLANKTLHTWSTKELHHHSLNPPIEQAHLGVCPNLNPLSICLETQVLRLAINNTPVPMLICTANGTIIESNDASKQYFKHVVGSSGGTNNSTGQGTSWLARMLHPDDVKEMAEKWAEAHGERRPFTIQVRILCQLEETAMGHSVEESLLFNKKKPLPNIREQYRHFRCYLRPYVDEKTLQVRNWVATAMCIENESTIQEIKSIADSKARFLAEMSHEIRTPLACVIGTASLLKYTKLTDEQEELLKTIRVCSQQLFNLINNILDLSKIEQSRLVIDRQPVHLEKCLTDLLDVFANDVNGRAVDLSLLIDTRVPEWILTDEQRLRQVVTNLLSNAVKFTNPGTFVTIEVHRVTRINSEQEKYFKEHSAPPELLALFTEDDNGSNNLGQYLVFAIRDCGPGIPDHIPPDRIFESFVQLDQIRPKGGTVGSGLGLTISKRLVALMGGTIWYHTHTSDGSKIFTRIYDDLSCSGGTTFYFTIDLTDGCNIVSSNGTSLTMTTPSDFLPTPAALQALQECVHAMCNSVEIRFLIWMSRIEISRIYKEILSRVRGISVEVLRCRSEDCCNPSMEIDEPESELTSPSSPRKKATVACASTPSKGSSSVHRHCQHYATLKEEDECQLEWLEQAIQEYHISMHKQAMVLISDQVSSCTIKHLLSERNLAFSAVLLSFDRPSSDVCEAKTVQCGRKPIKPSWLVKAVHEVLLPSLLKFGSTSSLATILDANGLRREKSVKVSPKTDKSSASIGKALSSPPRITANQAQITSMTPVRFTIPSSFKSPTTPNRVLKESNLVSPSLPNTLPTPPSTMKLLSNMARDYPLHFLIAEDNLMNQQLLVRILQKHGYQMHKDIEVVEHGQAALDLVKDRFEQLKTDIDEGGSNETVSISLAQTSIPNIIFMDMQMPIMDGCTASTAIRQIFKTKTDENNEKVKELIKSTYIHIISLTANAFMEDQARCDQAGMCTYLTKPVRLETLEAEVIKGYRAVHGEIQCKCNL